MRIGVGLSIPELSTRGGRFSPASLFTGGVAGAWYDPSDYSTLFQDSAGTTPVTAVEQPVGLMLDKSQGLVLGSELVTGSASAYSGNGTVATVGDTITATCTTNGIYGITWLSTFVSDQWVLLTVQVVTNSASKSLLIFPNGNSTALAGGTTTGNKSFIALAPTATGSTRCPIFYINGLAGESFSVRLVSIKSYAGNHASQATAASRPVLRARYNLLTYSEQFDNAAWSKFRCTVSNATSITAPDGTNTAEKLVPDNGLTGAFVYNTSFVASVTGATYVASVYVKAAELGFAFVAINNRASSTLGGICVNLSDGTTSNAGAAGTFSVTALANGWYRVTASTVASSTQGYLEVSPLAVAGSFNSYTGNGTSGIYVWGADLRTGSSAGTYQRIAAATDYATAGFLPYLAFDGTDDSFGTGSINFSATDKMAVVAGITKLSDASVSIPFELSANHVANAGSFALYASASALPNYEFRMTSTANAYRTATTYNAPITNVLSCAYDIAQSTVATEIVPKVNGATPTLADSGSAGTGNFGNYPLFIGRRNNTSFPFNGRIYQLIVCGKTLSASELASTEAYVATKTGVTL